eukprot:GHVN01005061.1.p3 GENE.GHVN01005061.1~~GHVN01005061.1.p3  ORF type:complete len:191 (+),score=25.98 GHVN01005061.1:2040-2612(+)
MDRNKTLLGKAEALLDCLEQYSLAMKTLSDASSSLAKSLSLLGVPDNKIISRTGEMLIRSAEASATASESVERDVYRSIGEVVTIRKANQETLVEKENKAKTGGPLIDSKAVCGKAVEGALEIAFVLTKFGEKLRYDRGEASETRSDYFCGVDYEAGPLEPTGESTRELSRLLKERLHRHRTSTFDKRLL